MYQRLLPKFSFIQTFPRTIIGFQTTYCLFAIEYLARLVFSKWCYYDNLYKYNCLDFKATRDLPSLVCPCSFSFYTQSIYKHAIPYLNCVKRTFIISYHTRHSHAKICKIFVKKSLKSNTSFLSVSPLKQWHFFHFDFL